MTTEQSARSLVISSAIDEIIIEKFITKTICPNDELTLDYLIKAVKCSENEIKFLSNFENDLFYIGQNTAKVTSSIDILSLNAKGYILQLVKKYVYTSSYAKHTFAYDAAKFIDDKYYNGYELDFINEILNTFFDISNTELNSVNPPSDKIFLLFGAINYYHFHYIARDIYNAIIQENLHTGDNITEIINKSWESNDKHKLLPILAYSKLYEWFLEVAADNTIILRCDLHNNKNSFIMNFINTIIYRFRDNENIIKLLRQMHIKYGLLRKKH